ncbi:hypothetical protein I4U23_031504 [Adineta vaga]|nr:hypothetical protein I4U23_031504 [Adineta vaga]
MRIDKTPCNAIYRGCSWEHGFMAPEPTDATIHEKAGIWRFCNTSLCNSDGSSIMRDMCYEESCSYFDFPQDCELYNLNMVCGKQCGNQMC